MTPSWLIADATTGEAVTGDGDLDQPFMWGSVTKLITSSLLDITDERGLLAAGTPVSDLCAPFPRSDVTLEHLAAHQSGLNRLPRGLHWWRTDPYRPWTIEVMLRNLPKEKCRPPGQRFRYSNLGYAVLGHALGNALDSAWYEATQDLVLQPVDAGRTSLGLGADGEWDCSNAIAPAGGLQGPLSDLVLVVGWMRRRLDSVGPTRAWHWHKDLWFHNGATRRTRTFVAMSPNSSRVLVAAQAGRGRWNLDSWAISMAHSLLG